AGLVFAVRHVEITSAGIKPVFLGDQNYLVNTLGFTNTFDPRESPLVAPRGFIISNTLDLASNAFGSQIEFIRGTIRTGYYLLFPPKLSTPAAVNNNPAITFRHCFGRT